MRNPVVRKVFRRASFWQKLFSLTALVIVTTAFTVAVIGYTEARVAILRQAKRQVLSIVRERASRIETWLEGRARSAEASAASHEVLVALSYAKRNDPSAQEFGKIAIAQSERRAHHDEAIQTVALYDDEANLVAYAGDSLEAVHMGGSEEVGHALAGNSFFGDIHLNRRGVAVINLAAHVHSPDGEVIGAYVYQFATAGTLNPIVMDTTGLDLGGESYLVDRNSVMLTPSVMRNHPDPLHHKMDIPPVEAALNGETGVLVYPGFLGGRVVGGYTFMPLQNWAVITEMDLSEAYYPLEVFLQRTSLATLVALLIMLVLVLFVTRLWTDPLQKVINASQEVAEGNYEVAVPETSRQDEMAALSRVFNTMVVSIVRSREKLRVSQERLLQAEKMAEIGTLLASVVHEMRNPLSSIKVSLKLIARRQDKESDTLPILDNTEEDVVRLEQMLSGLLDYSRPPSSVVSRFDCSELAEDAIGRVQVNANNKEVSLNLANELTRGADIICDSEALLQALVNLLTNAVHASQEGQTVTLQLRDSADEDHLELLVIDEGKGMTEFELNRLFEPFFTTHEGGVGLGMSNVKKYVEYLDGKIDVKSAKDRGTIVRIVLPKEGE